MKIHEIQKEIVNLKNRTDGMSVVQQETLSLLYELTRSLEALFGPVVEKEPPAPDETADRKVEDIIADETKEGLEAVGKEIDRQVSRQITRGHKEGMVVGGSGDIPKYLVSEIFNCFIEHKKLYGNPGEALARTLKHYKGYQTGYVKEAIILGAFE